MSASLKEKVENLHQELIALATKNQEDFQKASRAFLQADQSLAMNVEEKELNVDDLEDHIFKLLALQQPVASDLRRIIKTFKIAQELETLHSYICRIGKKTRKILQGPKLAYPELFPHQFNIVGEMLDDSCRMIQEGHATSSLKEKFRQNADDCHNLKKKIVASLEKDLSLSGADTKQLLLVQGVARNLDKIAAILVTAVEDLG